MLKRKFLVTFAALMFLATGIGSATAQTNEAGLSLGPSARPFGDSSELFGDSDAYEYDAQLWAPYDVTNMDGPANFKTGFNAEFGYGYMNLSGPGPVPGADPRQFQSINDWGWNRRMKVGYWDNKDTGWSLDWTNLQNGNYLGDNAFSFSAPFGGFANPIWFETHYDSVDFDRQFRQRLSNGGYVEPFIGLRYISLKDQTIHDRGLFRFAQKVSNSAIGGHIGSRYFRDYGRFTFGSNLGLGALYNQQRYSASQNTNGLVVRANNNDNEFIPMLDLGVEVSYALTRDVSFRVSGEFMYAWDGVARVDTRGIDTNPYVVGPLPATVTSQDLTAATISFGIDWNR